MTITRIPLDASAIEALEILGIDPAGKHMVDLPAGSTREEILTLLNGKPSEADVLRIITDTILSTVNVKNALWPREADRPMNPFNNARTAFPEEQAQEAAKAVLDALKANGVKL
jgi:hypothetical protein